MSYKKNQRFTESSDDLDFTIEHQPEGSLSPEAIAYEAGKAAFRAGVAVVSAGSGAVANGVVFPMQACHDRLCKMWVYLHTARRP